MTGDTDASFQCLFALMILFTKILFHLQQTHCSVEDTAE